MRSLLPLVPVLSILTACGGGDDGGGTIDVGTPQIDAAGTAEGDCLNGQDDNGDGLADCADPSCAPAVACVDAVPGGWMGPVAYFEGDGSSQPTCQAPFGVASDPVFSGLVAPDATCTMCTCSPPSMGACTASGGGATVDPATWTVEGTACSVAAASPAGGCDSSQSCQPRAAAPFRSGLCIFQAGDAACPAGSYSEKHLMYLGFTDSRDCSACACGAPSGIGGCAASGGMPTGSADPDQPSTFCCAP